MWNLFAQNLDKILLDLIKNNMHSIWCTSVVQLIALVYKDQHVITSQKLLQNFLESSLSESSEDNESNTSPQYQNGSCSPTTDDSSDQASRETSTPELKVVTVRQRRDSCGSLEVLPNNSPAPSEGPLSPGSPMSPSSNKQTSPSGPLSPTSQKPMSPGLPLSPSSHKPSTASQPMSPTQQSAHRRSANTWQQISWSLTVKPPLQTYGLPWLRDQCRPELLDHFLHHPPSLQACSVKSFTARPPTS